MQSRYHQSTRQAPVTMKPVLPPSQPSEKSSSFQNPENKLPQISTRKALVIAERFRERNGSRAVIAIFGNYLVFAVCIVLSQWVYRQPCVPKLVSTTLYLISILIIASRLRALENLVHEASHNNLFRSVNLHHRLQFLYAFPVFRVVHDYRQSHVAHHKYLGDPKRDPDILRLYKLGLDRLTERPIWLLLGLPITGFFTYEYMITTFYEFWTTQSSRISKTVFWTVALVAVLYSSVFREFASYYLLPFFVVLPVIRYWAEASEHLGLNLTGELGSSRTNIGFLHQWYMNPHNDGYHAIHHLCSQIPFYLLPEAHKRLMDANEDFDTNATISYGLIETIRQLVTTKTVVKESPELERL